MPKGSNLTIEHQRHAARHPRNRRLFVDHYIAQRALLDRLKAQQKALKTRKKRNPNLETKLQKRITELRAWLKRFEARRPAMVAEASFRIDL